jgi:hypothetical protein
MDETQSKVRLPSGQVRKPAPNPLLPDVEAFQNGMKLGRVAAGKLAAWAAENPAQVVIAGLAAGFVLGKLLFRPPRRRIDLADL